MTMTMMTHTEKDFLYSCGFCGKQATDNYMDFLPEELHQIIWKNIFNKWEIPAQQNWK